MTLTKVTFEFDDGQKVCQTVGSSAPAYNGQNVEGTNMRVGVFTVMVAGERGNMEVIDDIKRQMQEKDAIGEYPYIITSPMWIYTITKPAEPYFTMYGTQYSAVQKHK